jgi:hypothetical protein
MEAVEAYLVTSDALHLLAECFRSLHDAKNLTRIELCSNYGHDLVLNALHLAGFPKKMAHFPIEPNHFSKFGYATFSRTPQMFAPYIKGLQVQPFLRNNHVSREDPSLQETGENPWGLHVQKYRPTTTELSSFFAACKDIESLELFGCTSNAELRLCHGCDNVFVQNFARLQYPNLSILSVTSMFISGSRLRKFVKGHATTLAKVDITYTILTDGTWRSVTQGLAKCLLLAELRLKSLRQKRRATAITRPSGQVAYSEIYLGGTEAVQQFLQTFIAYFETVGYLNMYRIDKQYPKYYEVRLFQLPRVVSSSD